MAVGKVLTNIRVMQLRPALGEHSQSLASINNSCIAGTPHHLCYDLEITATTNRSGINTTSSNT